MPYLNVRLTTEESKEITEKLVSLLMDRTSTVLGKNKNVISIDVTFTSPRRWYVGGSSMEELGEVTFYLDIKITEDTNTKEEKSRFIQEVFTGVDKLLGPITPASYIVIDDVKADSWGYQGKTQEFRFIQT